MCQSLFSSSHHGCFVKQLENPSLENVPLHYCVVFHAELLTPGGMTAPDVESWGLIATEAKLQSHLLQPHRSQLCAVVIG